MNIELRLSGAGGRGITALFFICKIDIFNYEDISPVNGSITLQLILGTEYDA